MGIMCDGHPTKLGFASNATIKMKIKSITPPAIEGGSEKNTTNMENTAWRTACPPVLKTLGPTTMTVQYDSAVLPEIFDLVNVPDDITITYPDLSTLVFRGWAQSFTPGEHVEGEEPLAEVRVVPGLLSAAGAETAPVYTPAGP